MAKEKKPRFAVCESNGGVNNWAGLAAHSSMPIQQVKYQGLQLPLIGHPYTLGVTDMEFHDQGGGLPQQS